MDEKQLATLREILSLSAGVDADAVIAAVEKLSADHDELVAANLLRRQRDAESAVDALVKAGRVAKDGRDAAVKLHVADPAAFGLMFPAVPEKPQPAPSAARVRLGARVSDAAGGAGAPGAPLLDNAPMPSFDELANEMAERMIAEHPDRYRSFGDALITACRQLKQDRRLRAI